MTLQDLHRSLATLAASPSLSVYVRDGLWFALFVDTESHAVAIGSGDDVAAAIGAAVEDMRRVVAARWMQERGESESSSY